MRVESKPTGFGNTAGRPTAVQPGKAQIDAVQVLFFGKLPPRRLDRRRYPKLKKAFKKLEMMRDQISEVMGIPSETFSLELCEGANASVSRQGEISIGIELLEEHQRDDALLVAILGHEMGHQPWTWPKGDLGRVSRAQLNAMYREGEARADRFAGKALADLGLAPDAICEFLAAAEKFEAHPPADYYPAPVRAQMIRDAFGRRRRTLKNAARFNPAAGLRERELR